MNIALTLALAATQTLVCTAAADPKSFTLSFTADGGTLSKVAVADPDAVLDPVGHITVYEYSGGAMTQSKPPKARPKFTGRAAGEGGFAFTGTDKVMTIELVLTPDAGGYAYTFTGTRMMDRTMRGEFEGAGRCVKGAAA